MLSLTAGVYILQKLSQETMGEFCLARNKDHLEELMERFLVPNEVDQYESQQESNNANQDQAMQG